jgi:hypothetical protein
MHTRFRKLAFFVGAAALCAGGLLVVACGTDNGSSTPVPAVDSGKGGDTGVKADGPVDPGLDGSPTVDGGTDADCNNNPKLRDFANNFRCAFVDGGDAGPICQNNQTCCNTSDKNGSTFEPSFCANGAKGDGKATCTAAAPAAGSTFVTGNAWECADKNQCGAGEVCCVIQDQARLAANPNNKLNIGDVPKTDTKHPQACGVQRVYNENGSRCRKAVGGNCPDAKEIKLCSLSDDNCGAGTKCTPFIDFQNFVDRGFCK